MTPQTFGVPDDAADKRDVTAEVRMVAPPGPTKPVRVGRTSYVCGEGLKVRVPADHRGALLRHGWADVA